MIDFLKRNILFNKIGITLILLTFFKPLLLYYYPMINSIYNLLMSVSGILIIVYYLHNSIKNKEFSKIQISIIFFTFLLFVSTCLGTHDYISLLKTYIKWISISMYTELLIKNNFKTFLNVLSYIIYSYIIINLLTIFIFPNGIFNPDGLTPVFFLGNDNTTTIMLTLGVLFIWIRSVYINKKLDFMSLASLFMVVFMYIYNWSATSMVGASLLCLYLIFIYRKPKMSKIFNYRIYIGIGLVLFLLLVIIRIQNFFPGIIESIFHKSATFTGRTDIWDKVFENVSNSPIFGLGVQEFEVRDSLIHIFHAHCTPLNVLLEGGLIGLFAFYNIFAVIAKKIKNLKNNEIVSMVSYGFLIYFIVGNVEVYQDSQMIYIFIVLMYYLKVFTKEEDIMNKSSENQEKKKILVIISGGLPIPSIKGGAVETLIDMYIDENEKKGEYLFDVYSTYAKGIEKYNKNYKYTKFSYIHVETASYQISRYIRALAHKFFHMPVRFKFIDSVIKDIKEENKQFDLVIVENNASLVPPISEVFPNKVILHLHNDNVNSTIQDGIKIYNSCKRIYTVSNYIKGRCDTCGNDKAKTITLFNGIDRDKFINQKDMLSRNANRKKYGIKEDNIVFVFSGRICDDKGVKELLLAFNKLKKENKNVKLLIVGASFFSAANKTPYINELTKIADYNKEDIIFTGYIDYKKMGEIYNIADVQVVPSKFDDPCPLTVLEGMTMGLPQIVSNAGGIPEEVTDLNAIKVDRENLVDNLYRAMKELANDDTKRDKMSEASFERSKLFDKQQYVDNFFKLVDKEFE